MAYKLDRVANLIQRNVSEILQFEVKEDIKLPPELLTKERRAFLAKRFSDFIKM